MFYTNDQYHPTPCHFFLSLLAKKRLLRRIFTQNIDGLERGAGLEPPILVEGHGTCSQSACIQCGKGFSSQVPQEAVNNHQVPMCGDCGGLIKPKSMRMKSVRSSCVLWRRLTRHLLSVCDSG